LIKKPNRIIGIALLIALFLVKPLVNSNGVTNAGIVNSYKSTAPSINGTLDPIEWADGDPITITLYEWDNIADIISAQIMSMYCSGDFIYYGVIIPDTNATGDFLLIEFRNNATSGLMIGNTPETMGFGIGHDMKIGYVHNNGTSDAFSSYTEPSIKFDEDNGGTVDIEGKCHTNATHVSFEWKIPFNSGDTNGRDFNNWVGIYQNFFVYYSDDENNKVYSQLKRSAADYDYCQVHIISDTPTANIPIITFILSTIGIYISVILRRKQKK
jgi:hypothetical protein